MVKHVHAMSKMKRTHTNGQLRFVDVNKEVQLIGWVSKRRNFGMLVFIDLRDRYGITQLVFDEVASQKIQTVRNEYILAVKGVVCERKDKNDKLATGEIEVRVTEVEIINSAQTTPLIIADETDALEDTRLVYRYLDLRRPIMQDKLITRHKIAKTIRNYLDDLDFVEIETPILTKSTPEGARDYLVPSRVHHGEFYALPQSPQLFKQLLMVSGFEKYYQIARCFRDEDLRADRQADFTQIDIEVSFMNELEIQTMVEKMMQKVMKDVLNLDISIPFTRMTFENAMNRYGSDKPDNRFGIELQDVTSIFTESTFKVFQDTIQSNGVMKAIVIENCAHYSRKEVDALTDLAKKHGAKGLVTLKYINDALEGSVVKFFSDVEIQSLVECLNLKNNDLILMSCDQWLIACEVLGTLRMHFANKLELTRCDDFSFLWVVDFPMFEYSESDNRYYAKHHPFTRPKDSDLKLLTSNPLDTLAQAYDMVLNGFEIGGGSLRIYEQELQKQIFSILGFSEEQIQSQFGFFVDAFKYGTPPHGGIAFGLDRLAMVLSQSDSIRDVIAFPKNAAARCMMSDAPNIVDDAQLEELHLKIK